ncbi:hypothetical protein D3C74_433350 [compost metagenome]
MHLYIQRENAIFEPRHTSLCPAPLGHGHVDNQILDLAFRFLIPFRERDLTFV